MFKVYLVDDDPLILDDVAHREVWQECGFEICGKSTNPRTAINEIERLAPHVVVCDLKMPGMDGVSLIMEIKARLPECEYIMLSAHASFQDSREFFLQNGFDYLLKPINEIEMQITLEKLARKMLHKYGSMPEAETPGEAHHDTPERVEAIMSFVQRNFNKKLTLGMLGDTFHLSPNYICNLFAKHYGQSFTAVVTSLRMKEAARLIQTTGKSLKEVAVDCGYANYFYFCRVFKEFYDCAPGDYAGRHRVSHGR